MEQSSNFVEKEEMEEMMNVQEAARAIEWVKAMGLTETDACSLLTYIATGVGLPTKEPSEAKESD